MQVFDRIWIQSPFQLYAHDRTTNPMLISWCANVASVWCHVKWCHVANCLNKNIHLFLFRVFDTVMTSLCEIKWEYLRQFHHDLIFNVWPVSKFLLCVFQVSLRWINWNNAISQVNVLWQNKKETNISTINWKCMQFN